MEVEAGRKGEGCGEGDGEWRLMRTLLTAMVRGEPPERTFTAEEMTRFFVASRTCSTHSQAGKLLGRLRESGLISPMYLSGESGAERVERWRVLVYDDTGDSWHAFPERYNSDPTLLREWENPLKFLQQLPVVLQKHNNAIDLHARLALRHRFSPPLPVASLEQVVGFKPANDSCKSRAMLEVLGVLFLDEQRFVLDMDVVCSQHVAVSHLATSEQMAVLLWQILRVQGSRSYSESICTLLTLLGLPVDKEWTERLATLFYLENVAFEECTFDQFRSLIIPRYCMCLAQSSAVSMALVSHLGDFVTGFDQRAISQGTLSAVNDAVVFGKADRIRLSTSKIAEDERRHRVEAIIMEDEFDSSSVFIRPIAAKDELPKKFSPLIASAIYVAANVIMFVSIFVSIYAGRDALMGMWAPVAVVKGFSGLVLLNSFLVYVFISRVGLSWLAKAVPSFLGFLSAHRWIAFHATAAVVLIGGGTVHAMVWMAAILPHMFSHAGSSAVPGQFLYIMKSPSEGGFIFGTFVGVSGLLLMVIFAILLITALPRVMRRYFEVFIFFHQFMWVAVAVLLMSHACHATGRMFPLMAVFLSPAIAWYIFELGIRIWRISHACQIVFAEILPGNGYVHLLIDVGDWKFNYKCGDYVKLCVPAVSKLEWHPFSIASRPSEQCVRLLIKPVGSWTTKLSELLSGDAPEHFRCRIDGPYESPTRDHYPSSRADVMVVFAAGVGVSLYSGQVAEWIAAGKRVELVWIDRDFLGLGFLHDELERAFPAWRHEKKLRVRVFCTGSRGTPGVVGAAMLMAVYQSEFGYNPILGLPVCFGRPDFDQELIELERSHQEASFAVFCCGPAAFASRLQSSVRAAQLRRQAAWSFSPEVFAMAWVKE